MDGTRKLADAALEAGVRRFVQISTIAVHGKIDGGVIDEQTPVRPAGDYGLSKAEAERMIAQAVRQGLPALTLRLANVYGPFGRTFVIDPIEKLLRDKLLLVGGDSKPSNTVYVDNVAEAIGLRPRAAGSGGHRRGLRPRRSEDDLSWDGFYDYFATSLGETLRKISDEEFTVGHGRVARAALGRMGRKVGPRHRRDHGLAGALRPWPPACSGGPDRPPPSARPSNGSRPWKGACGSF